MRYQIKDKHNFFIREDGDSSMVLFKEKHDQFILNGTGLVMFNLILENNQTQKVLEELKKIYENIEIAVLENDLQDIIRMLKMYGILVMEQEIEENSINQRDIFQHVPITSRKPVMPDSKGVPGFFAFWGSSRILMNPGAS